MPEGGLASKLKALILYRVFFVTLLLGSSVLFGSRFARVSAPETISIFTAGLYAVTILYGLLFSRLKETPGFAYLQIGGDIAAETALVYLSGGIVSWFPFTFLLTILAAGIILAGRAAYVTAAAATLSYGALLALQAKGLILGSVTSLFAPDAANYLYKGFVHVLAFYSIAFLSSYLANRLRRVSENLERVDYDYSDLKAFSRDVIQYIPVGLVTADQAGRVLTANPAAGRILGNDESALRQRPLTDLFPFTSLEHTYDERLEGEIGGPDGERRTLGLSISPLKNRDGLSVGRIAIFRDLTRIRAMEQDLQKREQLAALGELSAWIAHELRNPLASMKSSIEMLREDPEPGPDSFRLMGIALKEMDRLDRIITDFLTYARPRPPVKQAFDLAETLREILLVVQQRKSTRIRDEICDTLMVDGDPDQLKQVFLNLILNAEDATARAGEITVTARHGEPDAEVRVSDTGPGIEEKELEKIFFPYYSTKEKGTGLGLAIAFRIVEEHGGSIHADSTPGSGAAFTVTLPAYVETDTGC